MDRQFDELSKSLAEGVSRREALRKFGVGLAGVLLASVGLSSPARADPCPKGSRRCGKGHQAPCCPDTIGCCGDSCACPSGYKCCLNVLTGQAGCVPFTAQCPGL